jgi:hypothetical protein
MSFAFHLSLEPLASGRHGNASDISSIEAGHGAADRQG